MCCQSSGIPYAAVRVEPGDQGLGTLMAWSISTSCTICTTSGTLAKRSISYGCTCSSVGPPRASICGQLAADLCSLVRKYGTDRCQVSTYELTPSCQASRFHIDPVSADPRVFTCLSKSHQRTTTSQLPKTIRTGVLPIILFAPWSCDALTRKGDADSSMRILTSSWLQRRAKAAYRTTNTAN